MCVKEGISTIFKIFLLHRVPDADCPLVFGGVVTNSFEIARCRTRNDSSDCTLLKGVGAGWEGGGRVHILEYVDVSSRQGSVHALLWQ